MCSCVPVFLWLVFCPFLSHYTCSLNRWCQPLTTTSPLHPAPGLPRFAHIVSQRETFVSEYKVGDDADFIWEPADGGDAVRPDVVPRACVWLVLYRCARAWAALHGLRCMHMRAGTHTPYAGTKPCVERNGRSRCVVSVVYLLYTRPRQRVVAHCPVLTLGKRAHPTRSRACQQKR